jgi:hypothetical protein
MAIDHYKRAEKEKVYPVMASIPPPEWLGKFIHKYNQTVGTLFGLNYSSILEEAKKERGYVPF